MIATSNRVSAAATNNSTKVTLPSRCPTVYHQTFRGFRFRAVSREGHRPSPVRAMFVLASVPSRNDLIGRAPERLQSCPVVGLPILIYRTRGRSVSRAADRRSARTSCRSYCRPRRSRGWEAAGWGRSGPHRGDFGVAALARAADVDGKRRAGAVRLRVEVAPVPTWLW